VRHADAERRTWSFTLQIVFAQLLFGLAPLVPHAHHLFGALTVPQALGIMTPGALGAIVSLVVFRRLGPDGRAYRTSEAIESFLLYCANVAAVFRTEMSWPVLWILCPFSTVFWAVTKPYGGRLHASIVGTAHAALALAYVVRGDSARAWIALGAGAVSYLIYVAVAREGRTTLAVEAERNVAQANLNEAFLDEARRRVANALRDGIGRDIMDLARELDPDASASFAELEEIAGVGARCNAPCSAPELLKRIDAKCRPLCVDLTYESAVGAGLGPLIDAERALALVRVAQEFVRNAVVHGRALVVRVELVLTGAAVTMRIADDGSGLSPEAFARATGGLANAAQWMREHDGSLELESAASRAAGTALCAVVPRTDRAGLAVRSPSSP
jgi:signal transduction histidine kinase